MIEKDYIIIAECIKKIRRNLLSTKVISVDTLIDCLCHDLGKDNPRFDSDKFKLYIKGE